MILAAQKIVYYSKYDFYTINCDNEIMLIPNRINYPSNLIRIYYTEYDYDIIELNLEIPTILYSLGIVAFPSSEMALMTIREVYEDGMTYSETMLALFEHVTSLSQGITHESGVKIGENNVIPGIYSLEHLDKELIRDYHFITYMEGDKYYSIVQLKEKLKANDKFYLEFQLIKQFINNNNKYLSSIDGEETRFLFEIDQYEDNLYIKLILIKINNIPSTNVIFSPVAGRPILLHTGTSIGVKSGYGRNVVKTLNWDYNETVKGERKGKVSGTIRSIISSTMFSSLLITYREVIGNFGKTVYNILKFKTINK